MVMGMVMVQREIRITWKKERIVFYHNQKIKARNLKVQVLESPHTEERMVSL